MDMGGDGGDDDPLGNSPLLMMTMMIMLTMTMMVIIMVECEMDE